ncbi:gfo/Idh/MocA family oxidoreductase, partial [bacterium]|nr:gfo/Idh/MocA family oxidoreductase [bacterium]
MRNTRRTFLKTSTIAASSVFAAPAIFSQTDGEEKNDRLIGAAIGVGNRGSGIGKQANRYATIVACCDVDRQHAEKFSQQLENHPKIYEDYRKLLERKDIDFVTIGTPDHWHTAIAIEAMKTGKDVYCEKPLTLTIEEGQLLCKAVKETGKILQVGTQQRSEYGQKFLEAIAIARQGLLGKALNVTCAIGGGRSGGPFETKSPPDHLNWDFWLGQAPKVEYCPERCHRSFRWWYEYSGGKLTDWGAHHVDIAQWAIGCEDTGPKTVEGGGKLPAVENGYNTATQFKLTLQFHNRSKIFVQSEGGNGITLQGKNGEIFVNRKEIKGELYDRIKAEKDDWLRDKVIELYNGKTPSRHMKNFISCIKDRSQPISDVFTHHRAISSCHLCNIA